MKRHLGWVMQTPAGKVAWWLKRVVAVIATEGLEKPMSLVKIVGQIDSFAVRRLMMLRMNVAALAESGAVSVYSESIGPCSMRLIFL